MKASMSIFKPNLFENFDVKGEWWLPNSPDKKVIGTLSFKSGDSIKLEISGSFLGVDHFRSKRDFNPELILGLTNDGEKFTLFQNMEIHRGSSSRGGTGIVKYITNYLFLGGHFASSNEMQFSSCAVNYSYLEEWIGKLPFKTEILWEGEKFAGEKACYTLTEGFEASIPYLDATVSVWHGLSNKGDDAFRELLWEHTAHLNINPDKPRSFDWFWKVCFELRNLLSLFIGRPVYQKKINLSVEIESVNGEQPKREYVYLYFTQWAQQIEKRIHPMDILVRLTDIDENISSIIDSWFSKTEKLSAVYELYFGAMYGQRMYNHLHFLTLMQALETYHRHTGEGAYVTESDYEKVFSALVSAIPPNTPLPLKESLKGRLKYGNEYSLRKRVKNLLDELSESCLRLVTDNPESFIKSIVDTRNYLTHYTDELKTKALEGTDLYNANLRLKILLTTLLLKELGLEEEKIAELLSRNSNITRGWVSDVKYDTEERIAD